MRRWTSVYRFSWTPIITFGTRRLRLLEWVEKNLQPSSFLDSPSGTSLGLSLGDPHVRLNVTRDGAQLEDLRASDDGVASLNPALDGIFEVLEPNSAVLHSASIAWSHDLEGWDYDDARRTLAETTSGLTPDLSVFRAVDSSMLMDVEADGFSGQVEWGIVEPRELFRRVEQPQIGRLSALRGAASVSRAGLGSLPPASVFIDSTIHQTEASAISNREGIESAVRTVTGLSEYLCQRLALDVSSKIGQAK